MLSRLFGSSRLQAQADALYAAIVAQARHPAFYAALGVPDTVDGRFEMVALHAFLVLHRLKRGAPAGSGTAQALFDTMFDDMDSSLREMGTGDLGVGRRVKAMAKGFYGRIAAYDAGLDAPAESGLLVDALRRNVFGTIREPAAPAPETLAVLARYMREAAAALQGQEMARIEAGQVRFPDPEGYGPEH
jgi:cytochrome b pre-mRNA-processing protein 3